MTIKSPFLKSVMIMLPAFVLNPHFSWDDAVGLMMGVMQPSVAGGILAVHLLACLGAGLYGKFVIKNTGWPKTFLTYLMLGGLFWMPSGVASEIDDTKREAMRSLGMLENVGERLEGEEARVHELILQLARHTKSLGDEFAASLAHAQEDWVFDYSQLNDDGEFDKRRRVLEDHRQNVKRYQAAYSGMEREFRLILSELGQDNKYAQGAIKGFVRTKSARNPIMEPYLEAHVGYSQDMIDLLSLFEENQGTWSWDGGTLTIDSDPVWESYQSVIARMTEHQNAINRLARQLQ